MSFKIRHLALAIATVSPLMANAAGLDRSTQPSWAFTQDGTFAYVEHITISPNIEGKDTNGNKVPNMAEDYHFLNYGAKADINDRVSVGAFFDQPWGADAKFEGNNNFVAPATGTINGVYDSLEKSLNAGGIPLQVNNAADLQTAINTVQGRLTAGQALVPRLVGAQNLANANPAIATGVYAQVSQQLKVAGLPVTITNATDLQNFINTTNQQIAVGQATVTRLKGAQAVTNNLATDKSGTSVQVKSQNFTGVLGLKFGDQNQFQVYGGPALQKLEGEVHLRGNAYGQATGYDASIPSSTAYGWLAGIAYSKPEIALKAALTYRSEIDHDAKLAENLPVASLVGIAGKQTNKTTITTPKSVNLDFQTGLNPTTLLTAKVRWVPWGDFNITPKAYTELSKKAVDATGKQLYPKGLPLIAYDKDAWSAELGIGKKLSPKLAVSGSVGWDSGAGNPVTTLGPVEGNWNVGLGAKYNVTPEWSVSAGAKYLMFGDAKAKIPTNAVVGNFENNDGFVYGLRLTYQKK